MSKNQGRLGVPHRYPDREEALRIHYALQDVVTAVLEHNVGRGSGEAPYGIRNKNLSEHRRGSDPSCDVDGSAEHILALPDYVAGMEADVQSEFCAFSGGVAADCDEPLHHLSRCRL